MWFLESKYRHRARAAWSSDVGPGWLRWAASSRLRQLGAFAYGVHSVAGDWGFEHEEHAIEAVAWLNKPKARNSYSWRYRQSRFKVQLLPVVGHAWKARS